MLLPLIFFFVCAALAAPAALTCPGGYTHNQIINEGRFVKQCVVLGTLAPPATSVIGCLTNSGVVIPLGEKKEEGGFIINCIPAKGGLATIESLPKGYSAPNQNNIKCEGKY
ncbi:hypothetical protein PENTCL1PPCAC_28491, partial [Pristionchus entomophagus]